METGELDYCARQLIGGRTFQNLGLCPFKLELKVESLENGELLGERFILDYMEDKRFPLTFEIAEQTAAFVEKFLKKIVMDKMTGEQNK